MHLPVFSFMYSFLELSIAMGLGVINAYRGRVNLVAPGWTVTPMTEKFMGDIQGIKSVLQTMPLRKLAHPVNIANIVVFLSSDKLAGHISGQIVTIAGGMEGRILHEPEEINIDKI